jgi:hypothetical protein
MQPERIILDMSGRGGLARKWGGDISKYGYSGYKQTGSPNLRYQSGDNQIVNGVCDPVKKFGFMSPASISFIDVGQDGLGTPIDNDVQSSLVDPVNGIVYFFEQSGDIIYGSFSGSNFDKHSPSAMTNVTDSAIYYKNGIRTIYVAGTVSGGGGSGIIREFQADSFPSSINTNWSSSDVQNSFNLYESMALRLIPSGDGFMYVLNKNAVHRIDGTVIGGTEGTIYRDILLGPTDSFLTHGVEYNNYLYIVVQNNENWATELSIQDIESLSTSNGQVGVYVWNRQSTFFNSSNFIELPGVSYVKNIWVNPKNELMVMAVMPNSEVTLMKFNVSRFNIIETLPWGSHINNKSSMRTYGMFTYWVGTDNLIYRYGSENSDEKDSLNIIGEIDNNGVGYASAVLLAIVSVKINGTTTYYETSNKRPTVEVMYLVGEVSEGEFIFKRFIPYATNVIGFPQ